MVDRFVTSVLLAMALTIPAQIHAAEAYPARPIRMIIPFPPGGSNDIIGRMMGLNLGERLGKPVVIDNRAGASGILGMDIASKSNPDGYTMLIVSAAYASSPGMFARMPFDPATAFHPVAKIATGPNVLTVFPALPVKSTRDLIALAKAKPGQLNFASSGQGSWLHLACELFKSMAGVDIVHIPFKGGFPAMVDVMAGNSQMVFGTIVQSLPHVRSGKLRALGIAASKRNGAMPDVPTIDESGLPGYEASNWWGIMFPAGTSSAIVDRIDREIADIVTLPDIRKRLAADGAEPDYLSKAQFARHIAAETAKWTRVVKQAGLQPQ